MCLLMTNLRMNKEPLLHCSVFIELKAKSKAKLRELQTDIAMELTRSKIDVDRLTLRQKEGFLSVNPLGSNQFGSMYERVLPLHRLPICFHSISAVRQTPTALCRSISTALIFLLTSTDEQRIKQTAIFLFLVTAVRVKVI